MVSGGNIHLSHVSKCYIESSPLSVLRGLLFRISGNALYHYFREGGKYSLYSLPETSNSFGDKAIQVVEAMKQLRIYADWVCTFPAFSALHKIINHLKLIHFAVVKESGVLRSGSLIMILELIQQDANSMIHWDALINEA